MWWRFDIICIAVFFIFLFSYFFVFLFSCFIFNDVFFLYVTAFVWLRMIYLLLKQSLSLLLLFLFSLIDIKLPFAIFLYSFIFMVCTSFRRIFCSHFFLSFIAILLSNFRFLYSVTLQDCLISDFYKNRVRVGDQNILS